MPKKKDAGHDTAENVVVAAMPQTKSTKTPKLARKNKSRLPRRQKKALRKGSPGNG
jgi:hypothetical protein